MKVDIATLQANFNVDKTSQKSDACFDLRLNSRTLRTAEDTNQLITSKSVCTAPCPPVSFHCPTVRVC